IARWKILDNLRRSVLAPATVLLLVLGWTVLPGVPLAWTAAALAPILFPFVARVIGLGRGPRGQRSWRGFLRTAAGDLQTDAARAGLQLALMANEAFERVHAIGITLVRLGVTHRRLLEWEPMAATAARTDAGRLRDFVGGMKTSALLAVGIL